MFSIAFENNGYLELAKCIFEWRVSFVEVSVYCAFVKKKKGVYCAKIVNLKP